MLRELNCDPEVFRRFGREWSSKGKNAWLNKLLLKRNLGRRNENCISRMSETVTWSKKEHWWHPFEKKWTTRSKKKLPCHASTTANLRWWSCWRPGGKIKWLHKIRSLKIITATPFQAPPFCDSSLCQFSALLGDVQVLVCFHFGFAGLPLIFYRDAFIRLKQPSSTSIDIKMIFVITYTYYHR